MFQNQTKSFHIPRLCAFRDKVLYKALSFPEQYNAVITAKLGTNPVFLSQRYCHPLLIVGMVLPKALREKCESTNDIFSIRINKISN